MLNETTCVYSLNAP
ncbi:unnamed protein product, partial [Mesorhabditis belari]|uniref:Uncharacterized protein n=1 Tax=Mesorhabditis belari TaxID=2138241 RepID=A0AAF3F6F8_9BILA